MTDEMRYYEYTPYEGRMISIGITICLPITLITSPLILMGVLLISGMRWIYQQRKIAYTRIDMKDIVFNTFIMGMMWPLLPCICIYGYIPSAHQFDDTLEDSSCNFHK